MTPILDGALLCVVHRDGVTTTSSRAGTDLGWLLDVESDASPSLREGGSMLMRDTPKTHVWRVIN